MASEPDIQFVIFDWSEQKNQELFDKRGVCFEDVIEAVANGLVLDILAHHNSNKYPQQSIIVVRIRAYVYYVPFVEDRVKETIFLKTIIPSRKLTAKYR